MKIRVKYFDRTLDPLEITKKGEWVDLRVAEDTILSTKQTKSTGETPNYTVVPLNIAMKLPKGYEAIIAPRSSTYFRFGCIMANSIGIIDTSYSGNEDRWGFGALCFRTTKIEKGDRVCQFRIQLSQKATMWQKIKWLFTSRIKFVEVENLDKESRGGFGSTGYK